MPKLPTLSPPLMHGLPVRPVAPSLRGALLQELMRDGIAGKGGQTRHIEGQHVELKAPHFSDHSDAD
jgi:hypothetical protein